MRYEIPKTNLVEVQHFMHNQGSEVVPLNPVCGAECSTGFSEGICYNYNENQSGMEIWVGYFVPGYNCLEGTQPCTVKVDGNVMSCTNRSVCDSNNCNNQDGALIQCSGNIPNLDSCSGVDISVECADSTDSVVCD